MERKTLRRGLYASMALALPVWTCIAGASCTSTQPAAPPALGEDASGSSSGRIGGSSSGSGSGGGGQDATMPPKDAPSDVAECPEAGQTNCSGMCLDLQTDHDHCGSCSNGCSAMGSLTACIAGKCVCAADAGAVLCGMAPGMCVDTLNDPTNCGTCGHICQTSSMGVCQGGYCTPVVVAQTSGAIFDIVVDMSHVWWTQPGASGQSGSGALLRKTFASGSTIEPFITGLSDPRGIAKDLANIYWVDYVATTVDQVSQNQTPLSAPVVDWPAYGDAGAVPPTYPNAMHVAVDANNIYWTTNSRSGFVLSVPIASAGSVVPTVIASGQSYPYGITVAGGQVIWTNAGTSVTPPDGAVMSAPVGGGSVTTLASGEPNPWNIASDGTNVYWTDNDISGFVKQLPIGGGTPITLASNEGAPYGIAVDANNVYWTSQDDSTVNAIPIGGGDGGGKRIYAVQQSGPTAITVDTKNIYWANSTAGTILEVTK